MRTSYAYDIEGNLVSKEEVSGVVRSASWRYDWDLENRLTLVTKMDGNLNTEYSVEYQYCPGCSGSRTARIKRDGDGEILSWYRYEEQGINTLRVDEKYDSDSDQFITDDDQWRVQRYGTGNNKETVFGYSSTYSDVPSSTEQYVYAVDGSRNTVGVWGSDGLAIGKASLEQDAFGCQINDSWNVQHTRHLASLEHDADIGAVLLGTRWYSPERGMYFVHGSPYGEFLSGSHNSYVQTHLLYMKDAQSGCVSGSWFCLSRRPPISRRIYDFLEKHHHLCDIGVHLLCHFACHTLGGNFLCFPACFAVAAILCPPPDAHGCPAPVPLEGVPSPVLPHALHREAPLGVLPLNVASVH